MYRTGRRPPKAALAAPARHLTRPLRITHNEQEIAKEINFFRGLTMIETWDKKTDIYVKSIHQSI